MTPFLKLIVSLPALLVLASCSGTDNTTKADTVSDTNANNGKTESAQVLRIAAAANLAGILPVVIEAYQAEVAHGKDGQKKDSQNTDNSKPKIEVTYASSGKLFAQINSGAPYDLFLSADQVFPARYAQHQANDKSNSQTPFTYARGQLALYSSNQDLSSIKTLDKGSLQQLFITQPNAISNTVRITLANPELAPYGASAKAFLQQQGIYAELNDSKRLIQAENISQAFQYAHTATTDYGFVALSQLISAKVDPSKYLVLQAGSYPVILQDGIVVSDHPKATEFSQYLQSESAQKLFFDAGYLPIANP